MTTTKSNHRSKSRLRPQDMESPKEISRDLVEYVTDYAQKNPGYAALFCIGAGFILGWKLKPW